MPEDTPDNDPEKSLRKQNERLRRENERLQHENELLRQKVNHLIRHVFGRKSEKQDSGQLELLLWGKPHEPVQAPESQGAAKELLKETPARSGGKRKPRAPRIPENLPVEEVCVDPEEVLASPEAWRCIGEEVSEQLDYRPGGFLRRRLIRRRYVKRDNPELPPVIAPLPERLVERGLLGPGLVAEVIIAKYADHLPLYRQQQIFAGRHEVLIPRQTLCRAVESAADWFRLVVQEIGRQQFAQRYVQVDETPVKYLSPGQGQTSRGYFWVVYGPTGDTVYHWYPGRGHDCLKQIVPRAFRGTLQCDGYGAYETFAGTREAVELAACWAHARRKFEAAYEQTEAPVRSAWFLGQIALLYRIEARLRKSRASPTIREAVRQSQSRMIVERIGRVLQHLRTRQAHLPQSLMGKAIDYALGLWDRLQVYLSQGDVEIDTNGVENAIRPSAVGKKNWLFIGANEAGWRSAVLYSIMTSCRNHGIDPYAYVRDMLERLPTLKAHEIPDHTPAAWAARRRAATACAS